MPNIEYKQGYAIDQDVEAVVNSANNALLLGRSGAGRIKDITGLIPEDCGAYHEFSNLCVELGRYGDFCKAWIAYDKKKLAEKGIESGPTYVQLECLELLQRQNGVPFPIGDVAITTAGDFNNIPGKPNTIIHAIGMGYEWPETVYDESGKLSPRPIIAATPVSINSAVSKAFNAANELQVKSFAIPIMCARNEKFDGKDKNYGLTPKQSLGIILNNIDSLDSNIERLVICADNKDTKQYYEEQGYAN